MNWKAWAPLAAAVILGLLAAVTARNLVSKRPGVSSTAGQQVVVAKRSVLPGQALTDEDVAVAPLAWSEGVEGVFKNKQDVVGRVAVVPMVKGQPVLESLLAAPGAGAGLQALVPEGMRAITIEVNEYSALAGLVGPGCSVDVVATMQDSERKEMVARTVVQNIKVMAVGQRVAATATPKDGKAAGDVQPEIFKSVTLLATPAEAEALELASQAGRPRLVLRGTGDASAANTAGVTTSGLLGHSQGATAAALEPGTFVQPAKFTSATTQPVRQERVIEEHVVKVIRGGQESFVRLNNVRTIPSAPAPVPADTTVAGGAAEAAPAIK
jgi:pilus assembly protein CpaB